MESMILVLMILGLSCKVQSQREKLICGLGLFIKI
jgi:hypothetical protein